jgi:GNAT superfamily N-acetyltransferase
VVITVEIHPLTPERWPDLESLFGPRGACAGCWCMWFRIKRSEWEARRGDGNHDALREIVQRGDVPGLLGYRDSRPVGWCAVAPRETYPVLARSRVLKPVDERPAWSVTCFFTARPHRGRGVSAGLLEAAIERARAGGAELLEGYPTVPARDRMPDAYAYTGTPALFERFGFREIARSVADPADRAARAVMGRLGLEPRTSGLTCRTGFHRPPRGRCGLDHLFTLGSTLGWAAYGL